ncbi:MAG: DUF4838 domain-containing protein [Clostridia bacterium]|nr:DUF4838 domain-containing protein [Clostridia bacterium]
MILKKTKLFKKAAAPRGSSAVYSCVVAVIFSVIAAVVFTGCAADRPDNTDMTDTIDPTPKPHYEEPFEEPAENVRRITIDGIDVSDFVILYSRKQGKTAQNTAKALADYINRTVGQELPVIQYEKLAADDEYPHYICVSPSPLDTDRVRSKAALLTNDGYNILFDSGNLYFAAQTATGSMYGVFSFLEDYIGWRFYSSKFEKLIPRAAEVAIPGDIDDAFSPKLFSRDTFWYDTFDAKFAAKLKINGYLGRTGTGWGDRVDYAGLFVHTLPTLAGTSHEPDQQPCLTDPAIYEKVLANVRQLLKDYPDAKIVSVSQNDSYPEGLGCQCENCLALDEQEGTPMGSLLTFVNRIADDIKDDYPDVFVDTLAYRYTRQAPKNLKPRDNVIIRLCSIECCFSHPLDGGCERNEEFVKDIEAWSAICKNLFIWDYTTNYLFYVNPFPNLKVLYDDVRFFVAHNAIGLFEQGNGQSLSGEFGELRAYLIAKLLWNPDMTREEYYAYMDDFLKGYYGAGWRCIREYIDRTTAAAEEGHMGIYYPIDSILGKKDAEGEAFLTELKALWDEALALADDETRDNVERSSLQVQYALLTMNWTPDKSPEAAGRMTELLKKYNITHIREGGLLPENPNFNVSPVNW